MADSAKLDRNSWEAVRRLFDCPFFSRLWIIQELGLASKATLLCGDLEIDWLSIVKFAWVMWYHVKPIRLWFNINPRPMCPIIQSYHTFATTQDLHRLVGADYTIDEDFLAVLSDARYHDATDARDRIFAFSGHRNAAVGDTLYVSPDYTKPVNEIYTELATNLLKNGTNLQVLSAVQHDEDVDLETLQLPSWVPAWDKTGSTCPLGVFLLWTQYYYNAAPGTDAAFLNLGNSGVLQLCGFSLDTIDVHSERLYGIDLVVERVGDAVGDHNITRKNGVQTLWHSFATPDHCIYEEEDIEEAFSLTLVAGFTGGKATKKDMAQHLANFAAYRLELINDSADMSYKQDMAVSQSSEELKELQDKAVGGMAQEFVSLSTRFCEGRKFFRTDKDTSALAMGFFKRATYVVSF